MRIGIDIRLIGKKQTGGEVYFFNLVKYLARIDKENHYLLFIDRDPARDRLLAREIESLKLGSNFKIIYLNSPSRFWWNLWALPNYLKKNPVNIFHTQYIAPFWLPKNIKLMLTIHDISFNYFPQYIKYSDLLFLRALIPRSIRRADKVITVSESEKNSIADFYKISPAKVDFAYNGVEAEKYGHNFSGEEKENVRKKYNLPENYLLYIGTLQPRKNIPVIIKAIKGLNIKLVIAGNRKAHNFDKKIDETVSKNNLGERVIFPGWIEEKDKPVLLQMADCFVLPSLYEGFGIPIIEAIAAGTPIVCSDIPIFREISGDAALFCDPESSGEFTGNISKILSDQSLKEKLIKSGIESAKKFEWQNMAQKTLAIYKNII
ncbi:MAG: glycosyltransferase family 1 protein [Parcubacteria group bacterium]|jgi:glycosyltransferase involved in cell wall biosynthesis